MEVTRRRTWLRLSVLLLNFMCLVSFSYGGSVGINYGRVANNLPSPREAVKLIQQLGFQKVKLYDSDPTVLSAFAGTGIQLTVALPNEQVRAAALSKTAAQRWVYANVVRHLHNSVKIAAIAVGNEVLSSPKPQVRALSPVLVPAMANIHKALTFYGLEQEIKVSSPHSYAVLQSSYPPSSGAFNSSVAASFVKPMLDFLAEIGSPVMLNAYPFFAYESASDVIPLSYALFEAGAPPVKDPATGLMYTNLFDAQLDAFFTAMAALGHPNLPVVITETGWPSRGDRNEIGATTANAGTYVENLVRHITSGAGTPAHPRASIDAFIFALFNENMKDGPTSERNYGMFYPDKHSVYQITDIVSSTTGQSQKSPGGAPAGSGSSSPVTLTPEVSHSHAHHHHHHHLVGSATPGSTTPSSGSSTGSWCVANPSASAEALQAAIDYACGPGKADCAPIQPGQACFNPNTLLAHASFAFNSYYQVNKKVGATCSFGGASQLVQQDPSYSDCKYPTSI